jgi:hypothetical protein
VASRAIITTVVRSADFQQDSGFVYVVDLKTNQIIGKLPILESLYRTQDSNPRGGSRGARGVAVFEDRLVLANHERLLFFDRRWQSPRQFSHPWLGGVHDLHADAEGVWVCCTNADLVVKVSWDGDIIADWEWRSWNSVRTALGFNKLRPVDRRLDYRDPGTMRSGVRNIVHLNGVFPAPDGGLLLSFGRVLSRQRYLRSRLEGWLGAIAKTLRVQPRVDTKGTGQPAGRIPGSSAAIVWVHNDGRPEIVVHVSDVEVPNHNVWFEKGTLFYNDSNKGCLVIQPWQSIESATSIPIPGNSPFVRGLARLDENRFLVGSSRPAAIHLVDVRKRIVMRSIMLSSQPTECVFAACLLPDAFVDLPQKWPRGFAVQTSISPNLKPVLCKAGE